MISRRQLLAVAGALAFPASLPAKAGYHRIVNRTDDRLTGRGEASFMIAEAESPATGLAFWQTGNKAEGLDLAARLLDSSRWRRTDFVAAALYSALDGRRVALYGQWASEVACEDGLKALRADAQAKPRDAGVFSLAGRFPIGVSIPIRAEGVAAFREFWTNARHQDDLISRELKAAAIRTSDISISTTNVHRGTAGARVVSYLQFADASAQPHQDRRPESEDASWRKIARSEFALYDIVFVMTAEH